MKFDRKLIRNLQGTMVFMIDTAPDGTKTVRDNRGQILGRIVNGQTRDEHGNILCWDENLGLLLKEHR